MDDFERVLKELVYKLKNGKIISYFIEDDFNNELKMVEIVDKKGNVTWDYFDKNTGEQKHVGGI